MRLDVIIRILRKNQGDMKNKKTSRKPSAKGAKSGRKKAKTAVVVLYERIDSNALQSMRELELEPDDERKLGEIAATLGVKTRYRVEYAPSDVFPDGRLFASVGLQNLPSWMSRILSYKTSHELDIKNAAPVIIDQVWKMSFPDSPLDGVFAAYVRDRSAVFNSIRLEHPQLTDEQLKKAFLKCTALGDYNNPDKKTGLYILGTPMNVKEIDEWRACIKSIVQKLATHPDYKPMWDAVVANPKKKNKMGTFASHVWQKHERAITMCLFDFLNRNGRTVSTFRFDALSVDRLPDATPTDKLDLQLIRKAEHTIVSKTGFAVELVEKSLVPTPDDRARYNGPKSLNKISPARKRVVYTLMRAGQVRKLKRMGEYVMAPHKKIPGVYIQGVEDKEFINQALIESEDKSCVSMNILQDVFNNMDDERFPIIVRSNMRSDIISFRNCFFDTHAMQFVMWADFTGTPPVTDHFFDVDLSGVQAIDQRVKPTPLWDGLILHQMDAGARDILEMLIGRLFYPIGLFDGWQVMPLLNGDAGTGKGTILDVVSHMFPVGSVGCISSNMEKTFGLHSLHDKRLVQVPDIPRNIDQVLNQTDFQSMVSGEGVSIARKNEKAVSNKPWKVPMIWAGNQIPKYIDASGSVARRAVMFLFKQLINSRDSCLKAKILETELITVMLRCIFAYRTYCDVIKHGVDFWASMPESIREAREEVREETNSLANFLANGSRYCQIVFDESAVTTMEAFGKAYSNYMEFEMKKPGQTVGSDHHPFAARKFIVTKVYICKVCEKRASSETCGDHYNGGNNRTRLVTIKNMLMVKPDRDGQQHG